MAVPLVGVAVLAAAGCGAVKGADNANLIEGKVQFVSKCGACHTLARANTKGTVGPNLDVAFAQSLKEGLGRNAIRSVVEYQIANPNPTGAMPKDLAQRPVRQERQRLRRTVRRRSRSRHRAAGDGRGSPGAGKPAVETAGKLAIDANPTGQLAYASSKALATPGAVTVTMNNMSGVMHNIAFEAGENGATAKGPVIAASSFISKGATTVKLSLKPGKYTFFCEVPGHRQAGMYGTLTVK